MFSFKDPEFFYLLGLLPLLLFYYHFIGSKKLGSIKYSNINFLKQTSNSTWLFLRHLPTYLRIISLALLIVALARPQEGKKNTVIKSEGIGIALLIDISGSMKGEDLSPNRLVAAKQVVTEFVKKRNNDLLSLIVYGSEAFMQCPLTLDHSVLIDFLSKVDFIDELSGRTAIGMAMSTGINTLKKNEVKSKVMILLTDGENNSGEMDPITAAEIANTYDIKIHTIGIGKPGQSRVPITVEHPFFGKQVQFMANNMNEGILKEIAEITGGEYFNAEDNGGLLAIYEKINDLEKTKISSNQYLEYDERFLIFLLAAFFLFCLEFILRLTRFNPIP